jgi:hypothetical protein
VPGVWYLPLDKIPIARLLYAIVGTDFQQSHIILTQYPDPGFPVTRIHIIGTVLTCALGGNSPNICPNYSAQYRTPTYLRFNAVSFFSLCYD